MPEEINKNPLPPQGPEDLYKILQSAPFARNPDALLDEFFNELSKLNNLPGNDFQILFPKTIKNTSTMTQNFFEPSLDLSAEVEFSKIYNKINYKYSLADSIQIEIVKSPMEKLIELEKRFNVSFSEKERIALLRRMDEAGIYYFPIEEFNIKPGQQSPAKELLISIKLKDRPTRDLIADSFFLVEYKFSDKLKYGEIFYVKIENGKILLSKKDIQLSEILPDASPFIDIPLKGHDDFTKLLKIKLPDDIIPADVGPRNTDDVRNLFLNLEKEFAIKHRLTVAQHEFSKGIFEPEKIFITKTPDSHEIRILEYDPWLGEKSKKNKHLLGNSPETKHLAYDYFNLEGHRDYRHMTDYLLTRKNITYVFGAKAGVVAFPKDSFPGVLLQVWRAGTKRRFDPIRGKFTADKESAKAYLDKLKSEAAKKAKESGIKVGNYVEGGDELFTEPMLIQNPIIARNKRDIIVELARAGNKEAAAMVYGDLNDKMSYPQTKQIKVNKEGKFLEYMDNDIDPYPLKDKLIARAMKEMGYDAVIYTDNSEIQFFGREDETIEELIETRRKLGHTLRTVKKVADIDKLGSDAEKSAQQIKEFLALQEVVIREINPSADVAIVSEPTIQKFVDFVNLQKTYKVSSVPIQKFGDNDLVYGINKNAFLASKKTAYGGKTLSDLEFYTKEDWGYANWHVKSVYHMERTLKEDKKIHFFLDHIDDIEGILKNVGGHATKVTAFELRYILSNWHRFKNNVKFYIENNEILFNGINLTRPIDEGSSLKPNPAPEKPIEENLGKPNEVIIPEKPKNKSNIFNVKESLEKFNARIIDGYTEYIEIDATVLLEYFQKQEGWTTPVVSDDALSKLLEAEATTGIDDYPRMSIDGLVEGNHRLTLAAKLNKRIRLAIPGDGQQIKESILKLFPNKIITLGKLPTDFHSSLSIEEEAKRALFIEQFGKDHGWALEQMESKKAAEIRGIINKYLTKEELETSESFLLSNLGEKYNEETSDIVNAIWGGRKNRREELFTTYTNLFQKRAAGPLLEEELKYLIDYHIKFGLSNAIASFKGHALKITVAIQRALKDGYKFSEFNNLVDVLKQFSKFKNITEDIIKSLVSDIQRIHNFELTQSIKGAFIFTIEDFLRNTNVMEEFLSSGLYKFKADAEDILRSGIINKKSAINVIDDLHYKTELSKIFETLEDRLKLPEGFKGGWKDVYEAFMEGRLNANEFVIQEIVPGNLPSLEKLLVNPLEQLKKLRRTEVDDLIELIKPVINRPVKKLGGEAFIEFRKAEQVASQEVADKLNALSKLNSVENTFSKLRVILANIYQAIPGALMFFMEDPEAFSTTKHLAKFSEREIRLYYEIAREFENKKLAQKTIPLYLSGDGIIQQFFDQFIISLAENDTPNFGIDGRAILPLKTKRKGIDYDLQRKIFDGDKFRSGSELAKIDGAIDDMLAQYKVWLDTVSDEIILSNKNFQKRAGKYVHKTQDWITIKPEDALATKPFKVEKNSGLEVWKLQEAYRKLEWLKKETNRLAKGFVDGSEHGYVQNKAEGLRQLNKLINSGGDGKSEQEIIAQLQEFLKVADENDYPITIPWEIADLSKEHAEQLKEIVMLSIASAILTAVTSTGVTNAAIWTMIDLLLSIHSILEKKKQLEDLTKKGKKNVVIAPKPRIGDENPYIDFMARVLQGIPPSQAMKESKLLREENKQVPGGNGFIEDKSESDATKLLLLGNHETTFEFLKKSGLLSKKELDDISELLNFPFKEAEIDKLLGSDEYLQPHIRKERIEALYGWKKKLFEKNPLSWGKDKVEVDDSFIRDYLWNVSRVVWERAKKRRVALVDALQKQLEELSDGRKDFKGKNELELREELIAYIDAISKAGAEIKDIDEVLKNFDSLNPAEKVMLLKSLIDSSRSANENRDKLKSLFDNLSEEFKSELGIVFEEDKIIPKKKKKPTPAAPQEIEIPQDIDTLELEKMLKVLQGEAELPDKKEAREDKPFIKKTALIIEPDNGALSDTFYSAIYVPPMMDSVFNSPLLPGKKPIVNNELGLESSKDSIFNEGFANGQSIKVIEPVNTNIDSHRKLYIGDKWSLYFQANDKKYYDNEKGWQSLLEVTRNIGFFADEHVKQEIINSIWSGQSKSVGDIEKLILDKAIEEISKEINEFGISSGGGAQSDEGDDTKLEKFSKFVDVIYKEKQNDSVSRKEYNYTKELRKEIKKLQKTENKNAKKENKETKVRNEKEKIKAAKKIVTDPKTGKKITQGNLDRKLAIESYKKNAQERQKNQTAKERWKEYVKKNPSLKNDNEARVKNGMQKTNGDSAGCQCSKCKKLMDGERAAKEAAEKLKALLQAAQAAAAEAAKRAREEAEKRKKEEEAAAAKKAEEEKAAEEQRRREELEELLYRMGLVPYGQSIDKTIEEMEEMLDMNTFREDTVSPKEPSDFIVPSEFINASYGISPSEDFIEPSQMINVQMAPQENRESAVVGKEPNIAPNNKIEVKNEPKKKDPEKPDIGAKGKPLPDYYGQKQAPTPKILQKNTTNFIGEGKAAVLKPGGSNIPKITPRGGEVL